MSAPDTISQWIDALESAAQGIGFEVCSMGQIGLWPLLGMTRSAGAELTSAPNIYISAGIHGDEPAGPLALLELFQSDALPRNANYCICPLLNPSGLAAGTRENAGGIDLNRDYRDFRSGEIRQHAQWIEQRLTSLDLCLHLHEDWESLGFYLYELNFGGFPGRAEAILAASAAHLPTDLSSRIDGHPARHGIIRPQELPQLEEGHPEAIYFQQKFGGLNYTLEAPSSRKLTDRVAALKAAVLAACAPDNR